MRHVLPAVLLLLIVAACAARAPEPAPREVDEVWHDRDGFVIWNCNRPEPQWFTSRTAHLDPVRLRGTIRHEESHRALMMVMGCEAWREWRQDPLNQVIMEALAFCAQVRSYIRDGVQPDSALTAASTALATYPFGITQPQARAAIVAVCP